MIHGWVQGATRSPSDHHHRPRHVGKDRVNSVDGSGQEGQPPYNLGPKISEKTTHGPQTCLHWTNAFILRWSTSLALTCPTISYSFFQAGGILGSDSRQLLALLYRLFHVFSGTPPTPLFLTSVYCTYLRFVSLNAQGLFQQKLVPHRFPSTEPSRLQTFRTKL